MTFPPIAEAGGPSPFSDWYWLRDELVPLIGERACNLFAFSICDEFGEAATAGYFRRLLMDAGDDVEHPQVTEAERLLLDWGRLIARNPRELESADVDAGRPARLEDAFSPALRPLLLKFAALTIATNIVNATGGRRE